MEDLNHTATPEVKTESEEVSEILSQDTDTVLYDFVDGVRKEEVITAGDTTAVFREPTEQDLPTGHIHREDTGYIGKDFFGDDENWKATVVGKSPAGAELAVTKRAIGNGYELMYRRGTLPDSLRGWYTTFDKAAEAGRVYLAQLWEEARAKA